MAPLRCIAAVLVCTKLHYLEAAFSAPALQCMHMLQQASKIMPPLLTYPDASGNNQASHDHVTCTQIMVCMTSIDAEADRECSVQ